MSFSDFTGEFTASYLDPEALGPAVQTTSGIFFYPSVDDYDLGGTEVAVSDVLFGGMAGYYTFVDANGDGPSLHIRG